MGTANILLTAPDSRRLRENTRTSLSVQQLNLPPPPLLPLSAEATRRKICPDRKRRKRPPYRPPSLARSGHSGPAAAWVSCVVLRCAHARRPTNLFLTYFRPGFTLTQTWNTANALESKVEFADNLAKGLKAEGIFSFLPATQARGAKFNLLLQAAQLPRPRLLRPPEGPHRQHRRRHRPRGLPRWCSGRLRRPEGRRHQLQRRQSASPPLPTPLPSLPLTT